MRQHLYNGKQKINWDSKKKFCWCKQEQQQQHCGVSSHFSGYESAAAGVRSIGAWMTEKAGMKLAVYN